MNDPARQPARRCLPLFSWRPDPEIYGISINFGDALFPLIVERILGCQPPLVDERYPDRKFIAGGSALHLARDGDVLWGVGLRTLDDFVATPRFSSLTVAAVRGPLTRDFLVSRYAFDVPAVFGDPAILLPTLFPEWRRQPVAGRVGVVPHFSDRHGYVSDDDRVRVIFPNQAPERVVAEILTCDFVAAGSLHGLIVAEAFGIPARWLNSSRVEPELKYYDYYAGTGRHPRPAKTVGEAEALGGEPPPSSFETAKLFASFPHGHVCDEP
jgi:pyruvyltransferase